MGPEHGHKILYVQIEKRSTYCVKRAICDTTLMPKKHIHLFRFRSVFVDSLNALESSIHHHTAPQLHVLAHEFDLRIFYLRLLLCILLMDDAKVNCIIQNGIVGRHKRIRYTERRTEANRIEMENIWLSSDNFNVIFPSVCSCTFVHNKIRM